MYRYIALLHTRSNNGGNTVVDESLFAAGLERVAATENYSVYASADTPILRVASGAIVIGHLFWQDNNTPVEEPLPFATIPPRELVDHLIRHCWGEYVLLQGGRGDRFTILRDPSGGAGCAYSCTGSFVTSDISLATCAGLFSRQVDWDFIRDTLVYPHLKTGRTGLSGLRELLPGRRLEVLGERVTTEEAWTPWEFVSMDHRHLDQHEAQVEVHDAVTSTVKAWAEADRSILLELSGGLDSSIVAACLLEANADVACCNLVTPVPGADERHYARLVSELLQSDLHVRMLRMEGAEFEFQPPAHAVAPSTWFLQHASNAVKEALGRQLGVSSYFSGGGGDTVFGYTQTAAPAADAFRERGTSAGLRAIRDLAELHQCTIWKAGRLTAKKLFRPPKPPRTPEHSFLSGTSAVAASDLHPWFAAPRDALAGDRERIFDLAGNQVFKDGIARGGPWHLRMPLLSQPVTEACLKVPSWMWISGGRNRAVARDAFAHLLPQDILHRRSKGTFMNYSGAIYRQNSRRLRDFLLTGQLESRGLLDTDALRGFFDRDPDSQANSFMRIFDLCAAENWVRHQA